MKRCSCCGAEKPLDAFRKDRQKPDGYTYKCRDCYKTQYRNSPELQSRARARAAARRAANPEAVRAVTRESVRKWRAKNPDRARAVKYRRRARLAGAPHEPYDRAEIFARYSWRCAYCDAPAEHLDHVQPLSRGGADAPRNLLPACASCNLSKSAKTLAEWASTF